MKRFVMILLLLCLVVGCIVGYAIARDGSGRRGEPVSLYDPENVTGPTGSDAAETAGQTEATETLPETQGADVGGQTETEQSAEEPVKEPGRLDLSALRDLYEPDDVVGSLDGRDITWEEYFYWLRTVGSQTQSYIDMMAMYGQELDWTDRLSDDSEETLAEYAVSLANDGLREMITIETVAEEIGVELSAEDHAEIAEHVAQNIADNCGEEAGEEEFNVFLSAQNISRAMYDRHMTESFLYRNGLEKLYGKDGADVDDETATGYLGEEGYLCATHILLMTRDEESGEQLDDETVARKLAQAEELAAELRAVKAGDERVKLFAELKEQYCDDPGKVAYPDGYLFTPGTMVAEFEDAVVALEEYEISDPVKTGYGYHVIMRLPLDPDMAVDFTEEGTPLTARALYANAKYNEMMTERIDSSVLTLIDELKELDLTDYIVWDEG